MNVKEVDGRATPSIQAAPTSVAAFIIRGEKGVPGKAYRISNWTQFTDRFGSYLAGAYGTYAVRGFLDNGGSVAGRPPNARPLPATRTYVAKVQRLQQMYRRRILDGDLAIFDQRRRV